MGIAGRTFAIVRMTGQMRFVCIRCIVMYQFVFTVIVRFIAAAAGSMLMPMIVIVVVAMVMLVIVVVVMIV